MPHIDKIMVQVTSSTLRIFISLWYFCVRCGRWNHFGFDYCLNHFELGKSWQLIILSTPLDQCLYFSLNFVWFNQKQILDTNVAKKKRRINRNKNEQHTKIITIYTFKSAHLFTAIVWQRPLFKKASFQTNWSHRQCCRSSPLFCDAILHSHTIEQSENYRYNFVYISSEWKGQQRGNCA